VCTEASPPNPISIYSQSNLLAEQDTLKLADDRFCATATRQATVFRALAAHAFRHRDKSHDLAGFRDRASAPDA